MRRLVALALAACGGTRPPPTNEPKDVAVAHVDASTIETKAEPDAGAKKAEEPPLEAGWITVDYKTGREEYVGRDKAISEMKKGGTQVLVRLTKKIEECSSTGGSHVFFEVAFSKELPFRAAHFGGHGAHLVMDEKLLYVASVETHAPSSFGNGRGWCLEDAPAYDADVLAIVPVRSEGEGMRLLTELAK